MSTTIQLTDKNFRLCDDYRQISDVSERHDDQDAWGNLLLDSDSIFENNDQGLGLDPIPSSDNLAMDNLTFTVFDEEDSTSSIIQESDDGDNHLMEDKPLQVDSTGAEVLDLNSASSWANRPQNSPKSSSFAISVSSVTTTEHSSSPAKATVAAAAITAAMIIVPDEENMKRPRSPFETEALTETEHTVLTTSVSPLSPRSISFSQSDNGIKFKDVKVKVEDEISAIVPPQMSLSKQSSRVSSSILPNISHKTSTLGETKSDASVTKKRRAEAMARLRQKKAVRKGGKRVRYQIRKRIATTRPRVNGRFARRCDAKDKNGSKTK